MVSGNPVEVDIQLKRAEYFSEKILLHLPDDSHHFDDGEDVNEHGVDDKSSRRYIVHTVTEAGRFQSPLMSDLNYQHQIVRNCLEKSTPEMISSTHSPIINGGLGRGGAMELVGSLEMEGTDALEFYTPPSSFSASTALTSEDL